MTSRNSTPIRGFGQRSIHSTFLFRPPLKSSSNNKEGSKGSLYSLSSLLNRLHTTTNSVLPLHKAKEESLPIPSDHNGPNESGNTEEHHSFGKSRNENTCVIEESVFKLFNSPEDKVRKRSSECLTVPSRSQGVVKKATLNHLVVLGDDPKPKRRAYRQVSYAKDEPKPVYNHYENGTGWWNSDREGIDNDEVGHKEVWEGVGSTTLGGLDWGC